jgi:hypothetical protein
VTAPDYRGFLFPLNVFMHVISAEEGEPTYLHYGLFDDPLEPLRAAQERSTELLFSRLPPPPRSILEVGIGLATTLARLTRMGYDIEGITPDDKQIAFVRARHGDAVRVHWSSLEAFAADRTYDLLVFQESSQYIDSEALFAKAATLAPRIVVIDEFALRPVDLAVPLPSLERFLEASVRHGYELTEEVDLSAKAAPTVDWFMERIPRHRERLVEDLGLTPAQIDDLVTSGLAYRALYTSGGYGYRLLQFARG